MNDYRFAKKSKKAAKKKPVRK
jgi:hypothetical protein